MKISFSGSETTTNTITLESIQTLLSHALDPLHSRLDHIESQQRESRKQEHGELEHNDGPYNMSFDYNSSNHSFSETEEFPMTTSTNPWYILPRSTLVGSTHIEVDDYCLSHKGTNPMIDLESRNGHHVIRVLRNVPSVEKVLSLCRLESEVENKTSFSNKSFVKTSFNPTLQKELEWKV